MYYIEWEDGRVRTGYRSLAEAELAVCDEWPGAMVAPSGRRKTIVWACEEDEDASAEDPEVRPIAVIWRED